MVNLDAKSAYVHCTQTDKGVDAQVVDITDKRLTVYIPSTDSRLVLCRTDFRKPYVGNRSGLEFSVMEADLD